MWCEPCVILKGCVGWVLHAALISSSGPFSHSVNTNRILAQDEDSADEIQYYNVF